MTRCRLPGAWTELRARAKSIGIERMADELVSDGYDGAEVALTLLRASKELIEDQERQIEELKRRVTTYRIALLAVAHLK